jgi:hypothetical protein
MGDWRIPLQLLGQEPETICLIRANKSGTIAIEESTLEQQPVLYSARRLTGVIN